LGIYAHGRRKSSLRSVVILLFSDSISTFILLTEGNYIYGVLKIQQLNGIFNIILIQKRVFVVWMPFYFNFVSEIFYYSNEKNIVLLSFYPSHCCLSFFASGVNGFTTLPVITPSVPDLGNGVAKW
jgi:hypothetical protein